MLEKHQSLCSTPLNYRSALRPIHTATVAPPQAPVQAGVIQTSAHSSRDNIHSLYVGAQESNHIPSVAAPLQVTQNTHHDTVIPNMEPKHFANSLTVGGFL